MSDELNPAEEAPEKPVKPADVHDCVACKGTGKKCPEHWPKGGTECWACQGRGWFLN